MLQSNLGQSSTGAGEGSTDTKRQYFSAGKDRTGADQVQDKADVADPKHIS